MNTTSNTMIIASSLFAIGVLATGCNNEPPDGIATYCNSYGANTYMAWTPFSCDLDNDGYPDTEGCYYPKAANYIYNCHGEDEFLSGGADEGGEGPSDGIDPEEWPTHTQSLDYIKNMCTVQCENKKIAGQPDPDCDVGDWVVENSYGQSGADIENPEVLNCRTGKSQNKAHHSPGTTLAIPAGASPEWPSDAAAVTLACADFVSCAANFVAPVLAHLTEYSDRGVLADQNEADYAATSTNLGGSDLTLRIHNGAGPSADHHWVAGRVEYSAPNCGEATCPFYLGNLRLFNSSDTWDLHDDNQGDVDVDNVNVQLERSVLGVWRPSTGEVYIGAQMLDLRVEMELSDGAGTTSIEQVSTNDHAVFGQLSNGELSFTGLSMSDAQFEAEADLDYDSVIGRPPEADFRLDALVRVNGDGLALTDILDSSSDPDGDLDYELWLVDGQQVADSYVVPPGAHTVRREVRDTRFALDAFERAVTVVQL